jgi:AcrR family transcriptional regulator
MKAEERENLILDCAKKVFAEKGYYEAHVEDVITLAQIGKGTVYQYFRNKEDLFNRLLDRSLMEWKRYTEMGSEEIKTKTPRDYFYHRIRYTLEFFIKDPQIGNILLRTGFGFNLKIEMKINQFMEQLISIVQRDLRIGQKFGYIRMTIDRRLTSVMLVGAMIIIAYTYILLPESKGDIDLHIITENFLHSFAGITSESERNAPETPR